MADEYVAPELTPEYYSSYVSSMPSMQNKAVAITGTTTGTGFVAAKTIAAKGARVFLLNRDSERSVASAAAIRDACSDGGNVTSINCDLQDFGSVRKAAETLENELGSAGLDVLVNNAGVMALKEVATKDGYEVQMQTNHLSHFLLTSLLMPSLKKAAVASGEARIVNHTSAARGSPATPLDVKYYQQKVGELGGDEAPARYERYHQTKLANSTFTFALQGKLADIKSSVKALCAHPGVCPSGLVPTTVADAGGGSNLSQLVAKGHALEDGALPLLSCICNLDVESGDLYGPFLDDEDVPTLGTDKIRGPPTKLTGPEELSHDPAAQKILWEASEAATGETFAV